LDKKREWLCKESLLIKGPVIKLYNVDILVAYDEKIYKKIFIY